jgi:hypothetical protein
MDFLTFLSKVVEAIAWPATVLILLAILRKELPLIAKSLRRLKYKDFVFEFDAATQAIADEVKQAVPTPEKQISLMGNPKGAAQAKLEAIAELAPRAAILEAWLQVEAAAADVIRNKGLATLTSFPGPLRLREGLQKGGILNSRQVAIFEQLRTLRNEAVHVPDAEFTKLAVASYIESAISMASYLEDLAGNP